MSMRFHFKLGTMSFFLIANLAITTFAADTLTVREASMQMMGAGLVVPGLAAYCNEFVALNPKLLDAARKWNARNTLLMEKTVKTVKLSGDMSVEEKDMLDRLAFKAVKLLVEAAPDQKQFCTDLISAVSNGTFDLERREDLAEARGVILSLP